MQRYAHITYVYQCQWAYKQTCIIKGYQACMKILCYLKCPNLLRNYTIKNGWKQSLTIVTKGKINALHQLRIQNQPENIISNTNIHSCINIFKRLLQKWVKNPVLCHKFAFEHKLDEHGENGHVSNSVSKNILTV